VGYQLYRVGNVGEEIFYSETVMSIRADAVGDLYYDASPVLFGGVPESRVCPTTFDSRAVCAGIANARQSP